MRMLRTICILALLMCAAPASAALEVNLYLAPQLGDGTTIETAYRSLLNDFVHPQNGEWFDELDNPVRHYSIVVLYAEPATHQAIQADSRVTRLIPMVSATVEQVRTNFDTPLTSLFSSGALTTLRARIEALGIDTEWATAATTMRDLVKRILHQHMVVQRTNVARETALDRLYALPLTGTVADLTDAQRTAAKEWMTRKGMPTAWITTSTTVRQLLRYIIERVNAEPLNVGQVGTQ